MHTFSLAQLSDPSVWRNLPVNKKHREFYLSATAFMRVFNLSREDFLKLPKWRRQQKKKGVVQLQNWYYHEAACSCSRCSNDLWA